MVRKWSGGCSGGVVGPIAGFVPHGYQPGDGIAGEIEHAQLLRRGEGMPFLLRACSVRTHTYEQEREGR